MTNTERSDGQFTGRRRSERSERSYKDIRNYWVRLVLMKRRAGVLDKSEELYHHCSSLIDSDKPTERSN